MLPGGGDVDRIDSSAARVIASEPSSTAWTAAARTSRSRPADHPVAAAVQVAGQLDQAAGDVVMQPQACLQRGDERLPLLAAAERSGADHGEPSGDLLAAVAVEQPGAFDVDAGVDEGGRQPFREVLERVGGLSWPRDRASQVAPRTIVNGGS
jgi:hypothetical protein